MMKKTHMAIAITSSIAVISYLHIPHISIIGTIGGTAPDWDFYFGIKHRTITHSLLFLFISSLLISILNLNTGLIWFISYGLHLIADSFTKMGVPFLYPFIKKNYGFKLIKSGGAEDMLIFIIFVYLISVQFKIN